MVIADNARVVPMCCTTLTLQTSLLQSICTICSTQQCYWPLSSKQGASAADVSCYHHVFGNGFKGINWHESHPPLVMTPLVTRTGSMHFHDETSSTSSFFVKCLHELIHFCVIIVCHCSLMGSHSRIFWMCICCSLLTSTVCLWYKYKYCLALYGLEYPFATMIVLSSA